ncbi:hypothetical protein PAHAL_8G244400 [Panicum hallii]|uniref:Laccase n=1 Tax=Panicum hallii TaxID=206008 RepID=A0A2S3IFJ1_9POAL|nr:laccase-15-like [Panicum hallii]PAN43553.1 hypothetical protein PAHAL_8G244400 [Panicum hallii]
MASQSLLPAVAITIMSFLYTTALPVTAVLVEHTFVVSQMNMTHLCKKTPVTVVNGQLPGPVIDVTEGDSVAVHVINKSPYNITIHWHGVKQWLNCWADGVPMITQPAIQPSHNFTYRFDVVGQEGTLWWHAHVPCLRATLHGALIIRPRNGVASYPFPKPHKEVPIIIGDWWEMDLGQVGRNMMHGLFDDFASASTINGKLGDLFNCSGTPEDGYVLDVEPGKTYLLRVINAGLFSEFYLKIAGHKFTVVAADANYVSPYTTDVIAIAPGETVDALVVADAPAGRYYMVALPNQAPLPDTQTPEHATRGMVRYGNSHLPGTGAPAPISPKMPDQHDIVTSLYFHGNMTSRHHRQQSPVPVDVNERLFIVLGLGAVCPQGRTCERGAFDSSNNLLVATMNNVSFQPPATMTPLLEAHYYHTGSINKTQELPDRPPVLFNFTDPALIPFGPKERRLEQSSRETVVRRFRHGSVVEMVFQSSAMLQGDSNPMHLHGHDMFVLAQGLGNYDAAKDVASYNLLNPPMKNTVLVPNLGWVAVRFVANNPGVWFMHCHYEFHLAMGMAAVFIVEDGPTVDTSLPPPPMGFPTRGNDHNLMPDGFYLQTKKSESSSINGI